MTRRGRVPGVENYNSDDLDKLLRCISNVLPTGANEWESVRACYENYAAENDRADRDLVSLKKKFQALLNYKKPTGDAQCPNSVRLAREIQRRIEEKVYMDDDVDDEHRDEGGSPSAPHTPQEDEEFNSGNGYEDERQRPSEAEMREEFGLGPATPPQFLYPDLLWSSQVGSAASETTSIVLPPLRGNTLLGSQHFAEPTRERRVDSSNNLQTMSMAPHLGDENDPIDAVVFPPTSSPRIPRRAGRQEQQEQLPAFSRQSTNQVGNEESSDLARSNQHTSTHPRNVANGAEHPRQCVPRSTTNNSTARSRQNRRLSNSSNSATTTSNTSTSAPRMTTTGSNTARDSQQPSSTRKRNRASQNLVSTVTRELDEQSRYREIHAAERCLQQQLDAEKEASRLERDERTALSSQVERLQRRNEENHQHFDAQKERLECQHDEVVARMKAKYTELKSKVEVLQEKLADERDKSRGLENSNAKLEILLAGVRGLPQH